VISRDSSFGLRESIPVGKSIPFWRHARWFASWRHARWFVPRRLRSAPAPRRKDGLQIVQYHSHTHQTLGIDSNFLICRKRQPLNSITSLSWNSARGLCSCVGAKTWHFAIIFFFQIPLISYLIISYHLFSFRGSVQDYKTNSHIFLRSQEVKSV